MKIVIIPDKFKGSLKANKVANNIEVGINLRYPEAKITKMPLGDGGEGTSEVLGKHFKARKIKALVHDPLMRKILAAYYYSTERKEAYIEMSSASGSNVLKSPKLNGLITSTFGTGEMIRSAIKEGAQNIILGVGGSATNDGGTAMANALGYKFLDAKGNYFIPSGKTLVNIEEIIVPENDFLRGVSFTVLADVDNPFYGPEGAAYVYGPQKGLHPDECKLVDEGLRHLAALIRRDFDYAIDQLPGAGAAGGMGGGAAFFLNADVQLGANYMSKLLNVDSYIEEADFVISGEGKLDKQTLHGKTVSEIHRLCQKHHKPLLLVVGQNELSDKKEDAFSNTEIISLSEFAGDSEESLDQPSLMIRETVLNWISSSEILKEAG